MKIGNENFNFRRQIYLTFIRASVASNSYVTQNHSPQELAKNAITICFDPTRDPNLCPRIDFWCRHAGKAALATTKSMYALCKFEIYNLGKDMRQFFDAYNFTNDNGWAGPEIQKWGVVLQVGYVNGKRTTIFSGHISSFNMERQQNDKNVDNVWRFFCQYPDVNRATPLGDDKAQSGEDYSQAAELSANMSFSSGELFLRDIVMKVPREVYAPSKIPIVQASESFSLESILNPNTDASNVNNQTLVTAPISQRINNDNFSQFFRIRYVKSGDKDVEDPVLKREWQTINYTSFPMQYADLESALMEAAGVRNCRARVDKDLISGMQTIYISRAGTTWANQREGNWMIWNFQNLRNPPGVAANMIQFDLLMEPDIRPFDTIEMRVDKDFKHTPSFEANFSMGNTATVFAGANFLGLASMKTLDEKQNAIKGFGNIFNKQFVVVFTEFMGGSHIKDWSVKAECYGVKTDRGIVGVQ